MRKIVFIAAAFTVAVHAQNIQRPEMGVFPSGSDTPVGQAQQAENSRAVLCQQLWAERREIEDGERKMQWKPIEQQNAAWHRMNYLKQQISAQRC